eukprot:CAMPEP_0203906634 /NCGR_PEP_ID=MMETSP0359-20131031/48225_1 /ASSEMBLY_ACC=CAM_ASM_000338 /TAXON_ID=268821 /ORGANISM="Scrippsiella Hangoei, Strain SHTV-5" /LENGTH=86 /DNA_ID=CAMNT_0050831301 /DNA_START=81 /DNA_END=337 /DNA_ORIENTATION=+
MTRLRPKDKVIALIGVLALLIILAVSSFLSTASTEPSAVAGTDSLTLRSGATGAVAEKGQLAPLPQWLDERLELLASHIDAALAVG